nr:rhodanese-like domain-containing protein [Haloplanus ruber]
MLVLTNTIISPEEVKSRPDDVFILDIRPAYSFEEEHIDGSYNLPVYDQLKGKNFIGLDVSAVELPDDQEIAVVCFSGSNAAIAASRLREHGFNAKRMIGGINGWQSETTGTIQTAQTV